MMKENDLWLKRIKERLDDYTESPPMDGWERMEKELPALSPSLNLSKHKRVSIKYWAVAVAAALIIAVSSVSIWLLQSPAGDEVRHAGQSSLAIAPVGLPNHLQTDQPVETAKQVSRPSRIGAIERSLVAQSRNRKESMSEEAIASTVINNDKYDNQNVNVQVPNSNAREESKVTQQSAKESATEAKKEERVIRRPSSKDKLYLPVDRKSPRKKEGWAMGLAIGNTGGVLTDGSAKGDLLQDSPSYSDWFGDKLDLSSTSNGVVAIPNGEQLYFKNGLPYITKNKRKIADADHKQPLSFGLSVRKGLTNNLSLETGVTYTYLSSDIRYEGTVETVSQKLHYVGIPLRVNWNFLSKTNVVLYLSGGGTVEKCVYGQIDGDKETVKPLQFSLAGSAGAQYNLSKKVGLYLEPGVSYYFDDGSDVETIRKKNPFTFTLQAGVRLTY